MVVFRHGTRHNDVFRDEKRVIAHIPPKNYDFVFIQRRRCSCVNTFIVVVFKYP